MKKSLEAELQHYPRCYITDAEISLLMKGVSADSKSSKIKRLVMQEKLMHLRRGLYCLTQNLGSLSLPHPFELAQYIYGPSYISLESALSYHKLIPEAVYSITSVSTKRSKEFKTPLGLFSYSHLPSQDFYTEVELIVESNYRFFMAKPWKAICDYVFCYKKEWDSMKPLIESLRINSEDLPFLSESEIDILNGYYQQKRISRFLKGIKKDLGL